MASDAFLEYTQARGFVIDTARVRKSKDKARVERSDGEIHHLLSRGEVDAATYDAERAARYMRREGFY